MDTNNPFLQRHSSSGMVMDGRVRMVEEELQFEKDQKLRLCGWLFVLFHRLIDKLL